MQMVQQANANWAGYDGLDEAFAEAVTLPATVSLGDYKNCMVCYMSEPGVSFDTTKYMKALYEMVVKPMIDTQKLLDARPYMTRLYTTMSAAEMTMDPVFAFNAQAETVSNFHTADRVVECDADTDPFAPNVPWTVMLPQGDMVRGTEANVWPVDIESQPAAARILQYASEGQAQLIEDNSDRITAALGVLGGGANPSSSGSSPLPTRPGTGGTDPTTQTPGGTDPAGMMSASSSGGGCNAAGHGTSHGLW